MNKGIWVVGILALLVGAGGGYWYAQPGGERRCPRCVFRPNVTADSV
ncbi:hypothetical protein ABZN20_12195 [Methylococcus sp. ANG]